MNGKPAQWGDEFWSNVLRILAAYIYKWSGPDSPAELSPEARDELRSRMLLDLMTGDPGELEPMHYVFRTARRWRVRGWAGDTETDRDRKRTERAAARKGLRDPGSRESEEGRNKSPYRGVSDDARQPRPDAILAAIETAEREGLRYVSDRQRKARRRPVKGNPGPVRYRCRAVGHVGRPRYGFGRLTGKPLYFPGAATRIAFEALPPEVERGEYDKKKRTYRPYVSHVGTVGNRAIGKAKTDPLGGDPVGHAMAAMAILGRTPRRRFVPPVPPVVGCPASPGDGTEWRAVRG
jgi:hypothetical protein